MEQKKHYLVYKTTCLLNGKIYIGQHQTYDPNDNYLGSGRELKQDIQNLGRENFKREILFDFDNFEDMDNKEKELVTEEFVAREDTYNVRLGGQDVDWHELEMRGVIKHTRERAILASKAFAEKLRTDAEYRKNYSLRMRELMHKRFREHPELLEKFRYGFMGKHHTEEVKHRISIANSISKLGKNNPNYGKRWISDTFNEIVYLQDKTIPLEDYQLTTVISDFEKRKLDIANKEMERANRIERQKRLRQLQEAFFSAFYDEYLRVGFDRMKDKFDLNLERTAFLHLCKKRVPYYDRYKRLHIK